MSKNDYFVELLAQLCDLLLHVHKKYPLTWSVVVNSNADSTEISENTNADNTEISGLHKCW